VGFRENGNSILWCVIALELKTSQAMSEVTFLFLARAQELLHSLDDPKARTRVQNVERTFGDTYNWVFNEDVGFASWLRDPRRDIFWIQGKPGSGKSTLMKYIMQAPRTSKLLPESESAAWGLAKAQPWTVGSHFFHGRGNMVERTMTGLLCEVLHHILVHNLELIEHILPYYRGPGWHPSSLLESFDAIAAQRNSKINLCLFIDALDEHIGDHRDLLRDLENLLFKTSSHSLRIKFCVSSRPENVFKTHLSKYDGFRMQDHTMKDIKTYISGRLYPASTLRSSAFKEQLPLLVQEIVELAKGVFLWVKLVVEEMIECIYEGDTIPNLRKLLSSIPTKMEGLYIRAIGRINRRKVSTEVKKRWARETLFMFRVMIGTSHFMTDLKLYLKDTIHPSMSEIEDSDPCQFTSVQLVHTVHRLMSGIEEPDQYVSVEETAQWIAGRSAGLLECVVFPTDEASGDMIVQFIHQTAMDFVTTHDVRSILAPSLGNSREEDDEALWKNDKPGVIFALTNGTLYDVTSPRLLKVKQLLETIQRPVSKTEVHQQESFHQLRSRSHGSAHKGV